jgi:hypothetical protein
MRRSHRKDPNTSGEGTAFVDTPSTAERVKLRGCMMQGVSVMMNATEPVMEARPEHTEGRIARSIEQQTAKLPSDTFLWAAFASIGVSLALELTGNQKAANFVGHWAPTILILGLYNKLVKLQGSH